MPPPHGEEYDDYVAEFLETGDAEDDRRSGSEVRGRRKDGQHFPLDLHLSEFDDGAGRRFVGTIRDITERKRTEEQVRQQSGRAGARAPGRHHRASGGRTRARAEPAPHRDRERGRGLCDLRPVGQATSRAGCSSLLERAGAEALRAGEIVHHLREFVQRSERTARVGGPLRGGPQRDPLVGAGDGARADHAASRAAAAGAAGPRRPRPDRAGPREHRAECHRRHPRGRTSETREIRIRTSPDRGRRWPR